MGTRSNLVECYECFARVPREKAYPIALGNHYVCSLNCLRDYTRWVRLGIQALLEGDVEIYERPQLWVARKFGQ